VFASPNVNLSLETPWQCQDTGESVVSRAAALETEGLDNATDWVHAGSAEREVTPTETIEPNVRFSADIYQSYILD